MATTITTLSSINSDYVDLLAANEPSWLASMRRNAFSQYQSLPAEVSPLYGKYSDVNKIKPESIHFAAPTRKPAVLSKDLSDRLKELEQETGILQVGQQISRIFVPDSLSKQGIIISGVNEALINHSELIRSHMDANQQNYLEDKFLALEASAFQSGIFIYIPRNVVLEEPIRLITSLADDGTSIVSRNIVIADTGSKATVVQELYAPGAPGREENVQQGYFELVETHVNPNAHLELVTLQAMGPDTVNVSNKKAFVERDAKMSWYIGMFGSLLSRYKTDSVMKGPGASSEDVEIVFGAGNQSFDVTSNLIHRGPHTRGRVLVKSVLKDNSKSLFKGMIKIDKEGKGTESYLAGHAILLDRGAKSDAIPGLEIKTNEVKATHSASVAQMDEYQIYYLMTRGLNTDGAKREIVAGFLEPLSRKMGPTIRAWINYLIENKWQGKQLMLRTDEAMEQILEVEKSRYRETQDLFEKHYKYR
jgi:FeS assembly protein SufD